MRTEALDGIIFGATITDVALTDLDDTTWNQIEHAFNTHGLLVFPGQHLDHDSAATFAMRFGPLQREAKRAHSITNRQEDGTTLSDRDPTWLTLSYPTRYWHADGTFGLIPPKACMLAAASVVSDGGQTAFVDMTAACEALDSELRERIDGLSAFHSNLVGTMRVLPKVNRDYLYSLVGDTPEDGTYGLGMSVECPLRPLVRMHPVTGRPSIFAGRHTFGIPGMALEDADDLLRELEAFAAQPPRVYEHNWAVGDVIIWDNLRLLHRACDYDDQKETRELLNCRVAGDPNTDAGLDTHEARKSAEIQRSELTRLLTRPT